MLASAYRYLFLGVSVVWGTLPGYHGDDEGYGADSSQEHYHGDQNHSERTQLRGDVEGEAHGAEGRGDFEEGGQEFEPVRDHERQGAQEYEQRGRRQDGESALATSGRGSVRQRRVILSCPLTWATTMRATRARVVTFMPPPVEVGAVPTNMSTTCTRSVGSRISG